MVRNLKAVRQVIASLPLDPGLVAMSASPRRAALLLSGGLVAALASCDPTTAPPPPPPALAVVQATAASHTEVVLSWPAPPEPVLEFRIERARGGGPFVPVATVSGQTLTYRDGGLEPATLYHYRVRACGEGGCSPFTGASVTTHAALVILTEDLPDAVRGAPYTAGLSAEGGAGGYTWSLESGSLPAGLALSEPGIVSGVPETEQTATFVARVRSEDGQEASRELSITVVAPANGQALGIVTPRLPPALADAPYGVELAATGGDDTTYVWSVTDGSLPPGLELGAGGRFSGSPTATGAFSFTVRVTNAGEVDRRSFALVVVPHDPSRFNITPFEVSDVPPSIRPHLQAAVERWEEVIRGDLTAGQIPRGFFSSAFCGGFGELVNGTSVDDVIVMVDIAPIDGPGRILGQAGPCGLRESRLPVVGILTLDVDDLDPLVGTQRLTNVIFHEIGHVLGFGGLWEELSVGAGTTDPRFTGPLAVEEFQAVGGSGDVPVENTGGRGTADVHWRKTVFRTEIMTGFAEPEGVAQPLSRVTVASMADLGYTVDLGAADPFTLPPPAAAPGPPRELVGFDVVLEGPVRVLPMDGALDAGGVGGSPPP